MLSNRIEYVALPDRSTFSLPNGARLAVCVYVNVEVWQIDRAMPRTVLPPPMGQALVPDVPNWSWHEYGMRAGFWRQHEALGNREIRATLALNGSVCEKYPRVAKSALDAGWEFMGHGYVQRPMHKLENQSKDIKRALDEIESFCGYRPRSWESPGLTETEETLNILRSQGVEFVADWVIDDLPQQIQTKHGIVTTIPYTLEINDVVIFGLQNHSANEFNLRGRAQFDRLYKESESNVRLMAISIHPYLTGVPHRIKSIEDLLDYIMEFDDICFMTASEIGDWYNAQVDECKSD